MESPLNIGDVTTNSIQNRLNETHLGSTCSSMINSAVYSGQKVIQLTLNLQINGTNAQASGHSTTHAITILRRVKDSYVNVSQLFSILVKLGHFTPAQVEGYFKNEIFDNIQYHGTSTSHVQYNDFRKHENRILRGLWIPYDKAVSLALKFDIYDFVKKLFLIDVHDYDKLPAKSMKRLYEEEDDEMDAQDSSLTGSPAKRQKLKDETFNQDSEDSSSTTNLYSKIVKASSRNPNYPYTLSPVTKFSEDVATELKIKLGDSFRLDDEKSSELSSREITGIFQPLLSKHSSTSVLDIPLDQKSQTALHFAATLASSALISSFIDLGIGSPIRGNINGESPLVSTIQVTNAMEKGNFGEILKSWLFPNVWLLDNKKWTILHHLIFQANKKFESAKFYFKKIVEYVVSDEKLLHDLKIKLINAQDEEDGNTCLHMAAEYELRWFIEVLLRLGADPNLANKGGIKPAEFEIVKDVIEEQKNEIESNDDEDAHFFELIKTSEEFLNKRLDIVDNFDIEEPTDLSESKPQETNTDNIDGKSSNKIFQSIQNLLQNTNLEYETILNSKRQQVKNLNQSVNDAIIVTANNRFTTKKISEKLILLDNLKLQISNINEKLGGDTDETAPDSAQRESQYIIEPLYEKLVNNQSVDELKSDNAFLESLQPVPILNARIKAYKEVNQKLEEQIHSLLDYSELTSKFKKVVSICTGVDVNEVDELLDGLLEAVEGQQ